MTTSKPKFTLGRVVATPGAIAALEEASQTPHELLARHLRGDWGDLDAEDAALNDSALTGGSRLFSSYLLKNGTKLWCITEAVGDDGHRASTCLLLPDEY
jgi:hypothetical protein